MGWNHQLDIVGWLFPGIYQGNASIDLWVSSNSINTCHMHATVDGGETCAMHRGPGMFFKDSESVWVFLFGPSLEGISINDFFPWPSKTPPLHTDTHTHKNKKKEQEGFQITWWKSQKMSVLFDTKQWPIPSMYGIFTYIYHFLPLTTTIHVGKYTSPMDGERVRKTQWNRWPPRGFLTDLTGVVRAGHGGHGSDVVVVGVLFKEPVGSRFVATIKV